VADLPDSASRIALARDNLSAKLGELRRRESHVRTVLSPIRHLANPWLHVAIAAVVGYRLGRPGRAASSIAAPPARRDTVIHAILRASAVAIAQAVARGAIVRLIDELGLADEREQRE
jgi:hypothetical protein